MNVLQQKIINFVNVKKIQIVKVTIIINLKYAVQIKNVQSQQPFVEIVMMDHRHVHLH